MTEFVSGWYLRGDIGYRSTTLARSIRCPRSATGDDTFSAGGGFGYKWKWIRADLTLDYALRGRFQRHRDHVRLLYRQARRLQLIANVYIDLGTWAGFTPYVGVGVGTTLSKSRIFGPVDLPHHRTGDHWNSSYASMAGVSYQVSRTNLARRRLSLSQAG